MFAHSFMMRSTSSSEVTPVRAFSNPSIIMVRMPTLTATALISCALARARINSRTLSSTSKTSRTPIRLAYPVPSHSAQPLGPKKVELRSSASGITSLSDRTSSGVSWRATLQRGQSEQRGKKGRGSPETKEMWFHCKGFNEKAMAYPLHRPG